MGAADLWRFEAFELDPGRARLYRSGQRLSIPRLQSDVLTALVTHAGAVVAKDLLMDAGWPGVAVQPNNLDQVISRLRKLLGTRADGGPFIETAVGEGYRFVVPAQRAERRDADARFDARLEPYRAFVQGRAALETLDPEAIRDARRVFEDVVREAPNYAPGHVGLANACSLLYESMRDEPDRDDSLLDVARRSAQRGCDLDASWPEAWSILAFVLYQSGRTIEAVAAACKAVDLDGEDWRHVFRLSFVSWGEERLRAARRVLALCPELALAYWLMTTVFIARGAFNAAFDIVWGGCEAEDSQVRGRARFAGLGLHLLHALLLGATGDVPGAIEELLIELDCVAGLRHIYACECAANTHYTLGAFYRRLGREREAQAEFAEALTIMPYHLFSTAALGRPIAPEVLARCDRLSIDAAIASAIGLVREGRHRDAAITCQTALLAAPPGYAGWILAVEPSLNAQARADDWADTLAIVRERAA